MQIVKEEFLAWLDNPVTKEVFSVLKERKEEIANQLANGVCHDMTEYAFAVGKCREIKDLLEMTYEEMVVE